MTTPILLSIFHSFGIIIFFLCMQGILFIPLTLLYETLKKRFLRIVPPFKGMVTVLIPAYNKDKICKEAQCRQGKRLKFRNRDSKRGCGHIYRRRQHIPA